MLEIVCSKGTYIRTLCQDIGRACNSSGHMGYLLRSKSGSFDIEHAVTLEKLESSDHPESFLISLNDATANMEVIVVSEERVKKYLSNGLPQRMKQCQSIKEGIDVKAIDEYNNVLAIGVVEEGYFKPSKVFKSGGSN